MLVDPDGLATDGKFPDDTGTAKVAALLLLDVINASGAAMTREQLKLAASRLLDRNPRWAKAYRGVDGAGAMVSDALDVLTGFGLVRVAGTLVHPRPAAARYAVGATRTSGPSEEEAPA
jgi:uncharacterized protein (TIGR02678 family)